MPAPIFTVEAAHQAIGQLAGELGYAVGDPAAESYDRRERYSAGAKGSAEVCLEDAQACRARGDWQHAGERAAKGLAHLGVTFEVPPFAFEVERGLRGW